MAIELANPTNNYAWVSDPSYAELKSLLYDDVEARTRPTDSNKAIYDKYLEIQVILPMGKKNITLDWLDTPGEIWRNSWQKDNQPEWQI